MNVVRYADRPDLLEIRFVTLAERTFPEYMNHNEPGRNWGRLYTDFPEFQVGLLDGDELVAEAHAIPVSWDGTVRGLPSGWDEGFEAGMESSEPATALMAVAISVAPSQQGRQLSSRMIQTFTDNARAAGLANGVIAPVRPTWKERYPLIPIERYAEWRRVDGRTSIPGFASTSSWAARSWRSPRSRWPSVGPPTSGRSGRAWLSPRTGRTSSQVASRRSCSSTASARMSSRTSGCTTRSDSA